MITAELEVKLEEVRQNITDLENIVAWNMDNLLERIQTLEIQNSEMRDEIQYLKMELGRW